MLKGEGFGVSISREMIIQFLILHIEPTAKVIPRKNTIDPITSLIHYLSHVTLYVAREFGAKNEASRNGKAELKKAELVAEGEAREATFRPILGFRIDHL